MKKREYKKIQFTETLISPRTRLGEPLLPVLAEFTF